MLTTFPSLSFFVVVVVVDTFVAKTIPADVETNIELTRTLCAAFDRFCSDVCVHPLPWPLIAGGWPTLSAIILNEGWGLAHLSAIILNEGCPTLRGFRRVGTTDLYSTELPNAVVISHGESVFIPVRSTLCPTDCGDSTALAISTSSPSVVINVARF